MEMPFGKYKGHDLYDIANMDLNYLKWIFENVNLKDDLAKEIETIINNY